MRKLFILVILFFISSLIRAQGHCAVTANFTASPVCFPMPVAFTNTSTGGATNYLWRFGDSTTSIVTNPTHTYKNAGTFTVTLIAGVSPCIDSISLLVVVNPRPKVGFAFEGSGCVPACVVFEDTTSVASPDLITGYHWNFGDGGSSYSVNPNHCYTSPGTFTVSLTATTNNGCSDSAKELIPVYSSPVSGFIATPNPAKPGSPVTFTDTITYSGNVTYHWNFGDGNTDTIKNPSHSYANSGTYYAWLVVTNAYGCKDSSTVKILVTPVSIQSITNSNRDIDFYPNPSKGLFTIEANSILLNSFVEIYNMFGEKIYSSKFNSTTTQIDLRTNADGIYLYRVLTESGDLISWGKMVIQK